MKGSVKKIYTASLCIYFYFDPIGLAGKNNLEKARVNMIAEGLNDPFPKFVSFMREKDEIKKVCMFLLYTHIFIKIK